jgi:tyramine---L-glutamate ligase
LRLLVYEHASGGGLADGSVPSDVLSEGFGMLRGILSDFKSAGHSVTTFLNSRLSAFNPPVAADYVIPINSLQEAKTSIEHVAGSFDAAYIIGPETNHILQSIIASTEEAGLKVLNPSASAIDKVADKAKLCQLLTKEGIRTPETAILSFPKAQDIEETLDNFDFPMVFKPLNGVGCSGLSVVGNETEIPRAIAKLKKESREKDYMVQEYVQGIPASVSLISNGSEALPISLNKQTLILSGPERSSSYRGGLVPYDSPLIDEAFKLAKDTVESLHELKGYVGVDLVLTKKSPVVIEVNPRLTTSYVGLRSTVDFNVGQAIAEAVLQGGLPEDFRFNGYSCFSKVEVASPAAAVLQNSYGTKEIVSPPFPLGEEKTHALLLCHGPTRRKSISGLRGAEKCFLRTFGRD